MLSLRVFFLALLAIGCGDNFPIHRGPFIERNFGSREFTAASWEVADAETRGQMVASLLKSHVGDTATKDQIFRLLGPSQCEGEAESDLCYVVTRKAKKYQLDFSFDPLRSNRVARVGLGEPQESVKTIRVQANPR